MTFAKRFINISRFFVVTLCILSCIISHDSDLNFTTYRVSFEVIRKSVDIWITRVVTICILQTAGIGGTTFQIIGTDWCLQMRLNWFISHDFAGASSRSLVRRVFALSRLALPLLLHAHLLEDRHQHVEWRPLAGFLIHADSNQFANVRRESRR